jgi:zinc protease
MSFFVDRSLDPGSLPGPDDIHRQQLSNEIVFLGRANFNSPSVVIRGFLPAGGLKDPDDRLGLADFTALALMRGTAQNDFQAIYDRLESVGASLGYDAHTHTVSFSARALVEDLDLLLDLLAETLQAPTFPPEQVERLRVQLLTGLALRAQNTGDMASLTFDQIVYDGHPYSRPEDGYPETVQAIAREDLESFHRLHYGPQGMVIALVGAVDPERAFAKVQEALGGWLNPDQTEPPDLPAVRPLESTVTRRVTIPGKSQTDIILGTAGPRRRSPDYLAAALGNSVLGQFGLYGRIGDAVRERAGLAYYAYSGLSGGVGPGPWSVNAGVDPGNVERAIDLIRAEIAQFVTEPVTEDELRDSQSNFVGRLPLSMQSNGGVANALINLERYNLGLDYYWRYPDLVYAVTPEDVLEAARTYLHPERLAVAVAGP